MIKLKQKQLLILCGALLALAAGTCRYLASASSRRATDVMLLTQSLQAEEAEDNQAGQGVVEQSAGDAIRFPRPDFNAAISGFAGNGFLAAHSLSVRFWWDEEEGQFYLFLPSSANPDRLSLAYAGASTLILDGQAVANGGQAALPAGVHSLYLPEAREEYPLQVMQSSSLYSLHITTASGSLASVKEDKEHLESGSISLVAEDGSIAYSGDLEYIKGHGNATWTETDKKAYQLKLARKGSPAAMGAAKKWMLVPNYFDDTLMRNYLTYDIAQGIDLDYTPRSILADCYINGEYQGNYQLLEKVEIHDERINIKDLGEENERLNPETPPEASEPYYNGENGSPYSSKGYHLENDPSDITGGYLLELEMLSRYQEESSGFVTPMGRSVVIKEPAYASKEQVNYISTLYEETEAAIFSEDGYHPVTGRHFSEYIDVESFAKKYIIEELSKNVDASLSSQYLYKPQDSIDTRFYGGPVWDYDNSWGYGGTRQGVWSAGGTVYDVDLYRPDTFYANLALDNATLWYGLYNQPYFYDAVCRIYQEEVLPVMQEELTYKIDLFAQLLEDSAMMNNYRWDQGVEDTLEESRERYRNKVAYLKDFAGKRTAFLAESWQRPLS